MNKTHDGEGWGEEVNKNGKEIKKKKRKETSNNNEKTA